MTFPQAINASASPEVQTNENFNSMSWAGAYANDPSTTTGLVRGYYGGRWGGFNTSDSSHTFGASTTTYVSVKISDGTLDFSTSVSHYNDHDTYARVETVVTGSSAVTSVVDDRGGPGGVRGGGGSAGGSGPVSGSLGTYGSRPSAATAGTGAVYYATDVQEGYISDGSVWTVIPSGGTELGYAEITSPFATSSSSYVDVTGLSLTVMVGERPVDLEFGGQIHNTSQNCFAIVGLIANGVEIGSAQFLSDAASPQYGTVTRRARASGLTPGSTYIFKAQLKQALGGTADIYGAASQKGYISVKTT